jgi:hypothetical protein
MGLDTSRPAQTGNAATPPAGAWAFCGVVI